MGFGPGRSADTSGGWRNHYRRLRRWDVRSLHALESVPLVDFHDALDFALAYFLWSHSLREWLLNDGAFEKKVLDSTLEQYPIWQLCRDVANRTRHFDLKFHPTDKDWSAYREYDPFSVAITGHEKHVINILFDGKKMQLTDAIRQSSLMWESIKPDLPTP